MQLSHSSVSKYLQCGRQYKFHYVDKLRAKVQSGALLFGSAIDEAFSAILLETGDPYKAFDDKWEAQEINGTLENLRENTKVVYANSDCDKSIFSIDSERSLIARAIELISFAGSFEELTDMLTSSYKQRMFKTLSPEVHSLYNLMNWLSLKEKGHLMVAKYLTDIKPKIKKVLAVQKKFNVVNSEGDVIIGFIDAIVEWHDGRTIVIDNKTSSMQYEEDSVLTSPQLGIYIYAVESEFNTRTAGFIVFNKHIMKNRVKICSKCQFDGSKSRAKTCDAEIDAKRCKGEWIETVTPEAAYQVIIDEVPVRTEELVIENFNDVLSMIKSNTFPRNLNSCVMPYGKCPYFNLCWKGDDSDLMKGGTR